MEVAIENVILSELRGLKTELCEFRAENNQRWEENDRRWEQNEKRWEENDRRWEQNEKRWEENNKRWEQNEKRWEENNKRLEGMDKRITTLEEGRTKDRSDILVVLDTMQKSISEQFTQMREEFNSKFEKITMLQKLNDIEHDEFKKLLYTHEKRLDFHGSRLSYLEEWKQQFGMGEFTTV